MRGVRGSDSSHILSRSRTTPSLYFSPMALVMYLRACRRRRIQLGNVVHPSLYEALRVSGVLDPILSQSEDCRVDCSLPSCIKTLRPGDLLRKTIVMQYKRKQPSVAERISPFCRFCFLSFHRNQVLKLFFFITAEQIPPGNDVQWTTNYPSVRSECPLASFCRKPSSPNIKRERFH